ncbi:MAG: DUF3095 family protein [Bacteroidota bacterium]
MQSDQFFSSLPVQRVSLSALLDNGAHFKEVPADWHVIITDIKNSTQAFRAGRSEEINLIATGCIIATLNLAQRQHIEVPFFFGGDGATLIVPAALCQPALDALKVHRENTRINFGLDLRVGAVPVASLQQQGHLLQISRLHVSDVFSIPVVLGEGLGAAERIVKGEDDDAVLQEPPMADLDLTGMECRWDKIKPASEAHEVVCLLVSAQAATRQMKAFKQVVDLIDNIYGSFHSRNPVTAPQLKMKATRGKIGLEMRVRLGGKKAGYLLKNWLFTLFGKWVYVKQRAGKVYIEKLVNLTDTLVIDGRINTVIAGKRAQRLLLETELNKLEAAGVITYGLFVSQESIMSCYVRDRKDKHIHFVDGADGGYTMAATMLKQKLRKL